MGIMAETRKAPAKRKPATKKRAPAKPEPVKHMNVYAVPVVEIDVTAKCSHGCFGMIPTSATVFNFTGIGNRIDVGPGGDQADILIHTHTMDDPTPGKETDDPSASDCESDCWGIEEVISDGFDED
jgi:hypothetical protein